jgi:hypothetical protein
MTDKFKTKAITVNVTGFVLINVVFDGAQVQCANRLYVYSQYLTLICAYLAWLQFNESSTQHTTGVLITVVFIMARAGFRTTWPLSRSLRLQTIIT